MSSDERCVILVRYRIRATVPATDSTVASEPLDFSLGPFACHLEDGILGM